MDMLFPTPQISFNTTGGYPSFLFSSTLQSSDILNVSGYEQIGLLVNVSGSSSALVRVNWFSEQAGAAGLECVESPGAITGGYQRYSLTPKEYGPLAPGFSGCIWLPCGAAGVQFLVYSNGTPSGSDAVTLSVMLSRQSLHGM